MKDDWMQKGLQFNAKKLKAFEREETRSGARIMLGDEVLEHVDEIVHVDSI